MFKKILTLSLLSTATAVAIAGPCSGNMWNKTCLAGTTDSVGVTGHLSMAGTNVKKEVSVNGKAEIKDAHLNNLDVNGRAELTNTAVEGNAFVDGRFNMNTSVVHGNTKVLGKLQMNNSKISGNVHTVGFIEMNHSKVDGDIHLVSDAALLHHSQINDITFEKNDTVWHDHQKLKLDNSVVMGNVNFAQGNGKVELYGKSKVMGKVIGGKIVNLNSTK